MNKKVPDTENRLVVARGRGWEGWKNGWTLLSLGEGNGNPLQYSCLENPRDGGLPSNPGGVPSMRLHRVGHDWSDLAAAVSVF